MPRICLSSYVSALRLNNGIGDGQDPCQATGHSSTKSTQAYSLLESEPDAVLIDVRTRAEWTFVGMPDLSAVGRPIWPVEWAAFGAVAPNPGFLDEVRIRIGDSQPGRLFFICRSGARSMAAATAVAQGGIAAHCTNVAEGFEGDLDEEGHRGRVNGWKVRGLPWRQR